MAVTTPASVVISALHCAVEASTPAAGAALPVSGTATKHRSSFTRAKAKVMETTRSAPWGRDELQRKEQLLRIDRSARQRKDHAAPLTGGSWVRPKETTCRWERTQGCIISLAAH